MRSSRCCAVVILLLGALAWTTVVAIPAAYSQTPSLALSSAPYDSAVAGALRPATLTSAPVVEAEANGVAPLNAAHLHPTSILGRAYLDAFAILGADNSCSQFFGGAGRATLVLNKLSAQLQVATLENPAVGIRMRGYVTSYTDMSAGISYRLFDNALVNMSGPFYPARRVNQIMVGSFWGNSREARALMLLHELAHLIKGEDGRWLIPDDAGDARLSERNTATIEAACHGQIRAL